VARACGQDLGVGLPKADDSYNLLIRGQLRLGVSERINSLDILAGVDIAATIAELAATGARLVLVGRVAAAAHGWPITLENRAALIEVVPASLTRFTSAAERCALQQAGEREWRLVGSDARLIAHQRPPRTSGYQDLARDAASVVIGDRPVRVASLIDLIRMAEGDPFSTLRTFTAALWSTLEMVRLRERRSAGAAAVPIAAAAVPV